MRIVGRGVSVLKTGQGYRLQTLVCDHGMHGIQRGIFVKLQFKTACVVALDYFIKSTVTPLHACFLTYTHKISMQTIIIIVHRYPYVMIVLETIYIVI